MLTAAMLAAGNLLKAKSEIGDEMSECLKCKAREINGTLRGYDELQSKLGKAIEALQLYKKFTDKYHNIRMECDGDELDAIEDLAQDICHDPNCPLIPKHTVNVCKDSIEGMGFMDHNEVPPID